MKKKEKIMLFIVIVFVVLIAGAMLAEYWLKKPTPTIIPKPTPKENTPEPDNKLCERTLDGYKYAFFKEGDSLTGKIYIDNKEVYTDKNETYFAEVTYSETDKDTYCNRNVIELHDIKTTDGYTYKAIRWTDFIIHLYKVLYLEGNEYKVLVDLTPYSATAYVTKDTKEDIDPYRIDGNTILVIQNNCTEEGAFKEKKYIINNKSYTVEDTTNTNFEPVAGDKC